MSLATINLDIGDALGALVWIAIFVVWVVGKLLGGLRKVQRGKTGQPTDPSAPAAPRGADDLRDFLETLTGQKVERPEEDVKRIELPPPPPPAPPTYSYQPRPAAPPAPRVNEPDEPMQVFRPAQLRGTNSVLVGLQSLRQPGASLPKADLWTSTRKHVNADLGNRSDLRRAMVQRIILSPPLALGGKPASPDLTEY